MHIFVASLALVLLWLYSEVALLLYLSHRIGLGFSLLTTVVSGVVGFAIVRAQGWRLLEKVRQEVKRGELPVASLLDSFGLLAAGVFLITPGLITDAVGALLLIPIVRRLAMATLVRWWNRGAVTIQSSMTHQASDVRRDDGVIDSIVVERHEESRIDSPSDKPASPSPFGE